MRFVQSLIFIYIAVFSSSGGWKSSNAVAPPIFKNITVSQLGRGDFRTIGEAIQEGVPPNNTRWIHIYVAAGVYNEKIMIPLGKPYIVLEGVSSRTTVIEYGGSSTIQDATITVWPDNFLAKHITFKNTFNHDVPNVNPRMPAVAAFIQGDKNSFYNCAFVGQQDTLFDAVGRHYFRSSYIEGAVDFIMGNGQSVYEDCAINVTAGPLLAGLGGYITAQHRDRTDEPTGFVFKFCNVVGTGPTFLGRAWGPSSRVLFYKTHYAVTVTPEGWDAWTYKGHESDLYYAEVGCSGPGSDTSKRVVWEKKPNVAELEHLIGRSFNDADGWIANQPLAIV